MENPHKPYDPAQVQRLEQMVEYAMEALELCASIGDYQTSVTKFKNRKDIFERAVQGLSQMVPVAFYAFYAVDDAQLDIELEHLDVVEKETYIRHAVDDLIERGLVALAFREKRTLRACTRDRKYPVLIHALATTSKIYGIFFCFLEKKPPEAGIVEKITTIIIKTTCYALENFELYQLIQQKNEELVEKNLQLSKSEIIYRNTFENTGNPTVIVDGEGTIVYTNSRFSSFSGWGREHLRQAKNIGDFLKPEGAADLVFAGLLEAAGKDGNRQKPTEYIFENSRGEQKTVFVNISPLGLDDQYILSLTDITPIKEAERQLQFQAFHDPLTRLPNRVLFQDRLKQAIKKKKRYPSCNYALIFIDLDRFKTVNDTLGHHIGDQLLVKVGQRIAASVREIDTVGRFGGDEFLVLLEDVQDKTCCQTVASRIMQKFREPIMVEENEIMTTISMGILLSGDRHVEHTDVIRLADMSMYEAKKLGRNRVVYSDEIEDKEIERRLYLENQMQRGIEKGEFFVQYQPLMDLTSDRLYGLETLVRWDHPELGVIPPNTFIPIAEETGLIIPLGRKILELAFRDFAAWRARYPVARELCLSINISVKQMLQGDLVADIRQVAQSVELPLDNVNLEITESIFIDDMARAIETINELKNLGLSISIDDFGTGYSSLKYLNQFSIDLVKIDKVLIHNLAGNQTNFNIVASMLELCRKLNLEAMAEGIEDIGQLEKLKKMNCRLGQGYYFAPPQDKGVIEKLLRKKIA